MELVNQIPEDLPRACIIDFGGSWDYYFPIMEFSYNKRYQYNIGMILFDDLYGQPYRLPLRWNKVGERILLKADMIWKTTETIEIVRDRLRDVHSCQKSFADKRLRPLKF